jgi:hypothetical protein
MNEPSIEQEKTAAETAAVSAQNLAALEAELLEKAAREYLSRKSRDSHPDGHFDAGGRWYPDEEERCDFCSLVRTPSRGYPYSLLVHCRTADHIASKYSERSDLVYVDGKDVRREARRLIKEGLI